MRSSGVAPSNSDGNRAVRDEIVAFWEAFRRECPRLPVYCRGTDFPVGMNLVNHAFPLSGIVTTANLKAALSTNRQIGKCSQIANPKCDDIQDLPFGMTRCASSSASAAASSAAAPNRSLRRNCAAMRFLRPGQRIGGDSRTIS